MKTAQSKKRPIFDHNVFKFSGILVAAGAGQRAGSANPKQYRLFSGRPVFIHALEAMLNHTRLNGLILVHPVGDAEYILNLLQDFQIAVSDRFGLVEGGETRTDSVRIGVELADTYGADAMLVHDAARPGLNTEIIDGLLQALEHHDGAAPALPVVDALKHWDGQSVTSRPRSQLYRIQTPQAFRADFLKTCLKTAEGPFADEFELAERLNGNLTLIPGSERLAKLTYPDDFDRLENTLSAKQVRMGQGFDVHAFEPGAAVTLCGISIPHTHKLKGHSDADVAWHALTDAILGGLAMGDIGDHFPPSDPKWKDAPSSVFLEHASKLLKECSGAISNVDLTIVCEAPKVKPHREAMRRETARILDIDISQVSVKATTTEELGFEGRREGISAQAIATLVLPLPARHTSLREKN